MKTIIIGAGFGGLEVAKQLKYADTEVILIDKMNHHLFQPLLYQVATASLSPIDIAVPVREILKGHDNVTFLMGSVTHIDKIKKTITLQCGATYSFDTLVVAAGAKHSYFGNDHWEEHAPGLKNLADAGKLREKILSAFEQAERSNDPQETARHLRFVVIGGGPTGVELAGAIAEIAFKSLPPTFRHINPKLSKVYLLEAASQLLPGIPESLALEAKKDLEKLGVDVLLQHMVTNVDATGVTTTKQFIDSPNVIWAAGNCASPILTTLNTPLDRQGRAIVDPDLSLPDCPSIFVIGDAACSYDAAGKPYPGLAPVAKQQGRFVAKTIREKIPKEARAAFRYVDKGSLATIGRGCAVGMIGPLQVKGFLAWLIWSVIHVFYLIGFRNRLLVLTQWAFWYIRGRRRVQLITKALE